MKPTISSVKFAKDFGMRHSDVLKKIRSFSCSDDFNERNFSLVEYVDRKGQRRPMYKITQQAFTFLMSRTKGRINDQYVELYIRAFEEMAIQIAHEEQSIYVQLNKAILEYMLVDQGASNAGRNLQFLGKVAKPQLRKRISELMNKLQLKLPFDDERK